MAPYVLTPNMERGELPEGSWATSLQIVSSNSGMSTPSTNSDNFVSIHPSQNNNRDNVHTIASESTDGAANQSTDGASSPKSTTSYEDAFVHGYKEGFAKAHIELKHQPIAIIGMSCRLPGSVASPDEFWELLARNRTGFSPIPASRFSATRFHHPNPGKGGTTNARGGNFLTQDLKAFDAPFFGFTQQEAVSLDPQQRLLLECTFEALESAGVPKHNAVGKDVGVFIGGSFSEYEADLFRDPETIPMHQATGCAMAMQSNRISHFFDFRGPSFTLDTACSSSLVALHTACQSLRTGESSMALVAGVHLNMLPEFWISMSMSRLFGDAGRSFAFDQRGTGYGRGEGCGMILLKPLDQALKDNDPIRAVIAGSGINQDGKTPGITMPNQHAQEELIRSVYTQGGMDPADTGYVEAHGTGTRVGDPLEVAALHSVFGQGRNKRKPLYIGSVKSNIGHLEAAAGIAGIIKTALMLERGFILPNYDFKQPNEKIPFDEWGLKVPVRQQPWPFGKKWASVNGFGFGGTNAHVVMTRGPLERKTMKEDIDTQTQKRLFVVSANDKAAADEAMKNLGIYLEQRPEIFQNDLLSNLAYTLGQRKSLHSWRMAISASSAVELVESLSSGRISPIKQDIEALRLGWVFTGQGAQWWAMGRELYHQYPIYASSLDRASSHLSSIGAPFSLIEELAKDEQSTRVNVAHVSQPACTAIQLALVELLCSWKISPSAVVGHSSGEIAAAYSADIINFEDAMTIAYHRGRLIPILKERYPGLDGCMLAVGASATDIAPLLERVPSSLGEARIACINSPSSVTISGDAEAVSEVQRLIEEAYPGTFARRLAVDTAYHSHHMNLVAKDYAENLRELQPPRYSAVSFHSSLLGRTASYSDLDATYWVQNLTCAVRFDEAVQSMCTPVGDAKVGVNFLVELGPHAALQGPLKQILKHVGGAATKVSYASALSRKKNAVHTALDLAGTLFVKGTLLDMGAINFPKPLGRQPQVLTDVPRYAWNHSTTYHHESRLTTIHKFQDTPRNDLLGVLAPYSDDIEPTWRNVLRLDDVPWLRHHQMQGVTIFPISGFLVMALEAMGQQAQALNLEYDSFQVQDLSVKVPALLTEEDLEMTTTLQPRLQVRGTPSFYFHIRSWSKNKGWTENCTGIVSAYLDQVNEVDGQRLVDMKQRRLHSRITRTMHSAAEPAHMKAIYKRLADIGVSYGTTLQGLQDCQASSSASSARMPVSDTVSEMPEHHESKYILHPTAFEQLITMYWLILEASGALDTVYLPSSIGKITVFTKALKALDESSAAMQAFCEPKADIGSSTSNTMSIIATTNANELIVSIEDLLISPIMETDVGLEANTARELCYKLDWEPMPEAAEAEVGMTEKPRFDTGVVIVHGNSKSQLEMAAMLSDQFMLLTGAAPVLGSLSSLASISQDKLCVVISELEEPLLSTLSAQDFEALQYLLTTIRGALWVVRGAYVGSRSPESNMITGLSRTLRSEGTLMKFVTLDIEARKEVDVEHDISTILRVFTQSLSAETKVEETEFLERDGQVFTPRIINDDSLNEYVEQQTHPTASELASFSDVKRPLRGLLETPNVMDSLQFTDHELSPLAQDDVEIQVKAVGLNSRDVTSSHTIGVECSGIVTAVGSDVPNLFPGDRVSGLTTEGALSTITRAQHPFLFKLPDHTTFESAATLPLAYCTASYALINQARLREDESILVHDAASANGQAALSVAQMAGADVWTTVQSAAEKTLLLRDFGVPEDRVLYAGSEDFADTIKDATTGHGVDVVFDSLEDGHLTPATQATLADFGRHVVIDANRVGASRDTRANTILIVVDIRALWKLRPKVLQRTLADVGRMLKHNTIRALQEISTYGIADAVAALHDVQVAGARGKVVITPQDNELVMAPRIDKKITLLREDATYILIGGTGGLGRSMAKWMVSKGAKNIVLLSRSGELRGNAKEQVDDLNGAGANIVVRSCDVADKVSVDHLISGGLVGLPPVRGIVHGAMVLHDVLFEKMTHDQYTSVIASKVQGARNFHEALSKAQASLDFFILISSAAGAVGNRGQAAYAAANTFLNAFAQHLIGKGIRAASLDLTAVSDAGYLAEDAEKAAEVARNLGSDTICEAEVLALLQAAIEGKLSSCNGHPITGMRITPTMRPFWSNDAKFVHLLRAAEAASNASGTAAKISWSTAFKAVASRAEAEQVVCNALVEKIADVISMEPEELDIGRALSHYPLDSLTAIEVRNFITRMFEASLQVLELLASGSIEKLAKIICTKTKVALPEA
ncbi:hypothetical protein HBI54_128330 [Parastagonospora nodorum]|nr:hypothetical protein HBI54_128330 [Parastagonospora nodorum]